MPKKSPAIPAYKRHPNGQAFVYHRSIDRPGHVLYLGKYGEESSLRKYRAFLLRLEADATQTADIKSAPIRVFPDATITELAAAYLQYCEGYYRDADGKKTKEFSCTGEALSPLIGLFGDDFASAFRPTAFETYRQHLINEGYARTTINSHAGRVRRMFRWAATKEMLPASIWQSLAAVEGLKAGRTAAREPKEIPAVGWEQVELALPHFSPVVAAMVTVQFWCGMRPQDVCGIRRCDLDMTGDVWVYKPRRHKNAWRGHVLLKAVPALVQPLLSERFTDDETEFLFSPREAIAWHSAERERAAGANRSTPVYPSEIARRNRTKAIRAAQPAKFRDRYTTRSYSQAVEYGLAKLQAERESAGLPVAPSWSPMQLRHGIATHLEKTQGRQASQRYLGHRHLSTTEMYVEKDAAEIIAIARQIDARQASS